jgi:hypothetical protein
VTSWDRQGNRDKGEKGEEKGGERMMCEIAPPTWQLWEAIGGPINEHQLAYRYTVLYTVVVFREVCSDH